MTTSRHPCWVQADHTFTVPLDHDRPDADRIEVYAREVRAPGRAAREASPGCFSWAAGQIGRPAPARRRGWLRRALRDYRVLLLDQRGRGRSTPVDRRLLGRIGSSAALARRLWLFRADAIVRDAEVIRPTLTGGGRGAYWARASAACVRSLTCPSPRRAWPKPSSPAGCPARAGAYEVYRALYPRVSRKNAEHYERFPGDADRGRNVARYLRERQRACRAGGC